MASLHIKNFGPISDSTKIDMTPVCDFIEAVSSQDESLNRKPCNGIPCGKEPPVQ